jgi:hypothetical protein
LIYGQFADGYVRAALEGYSVDVVLIFIGRGPPAWLKWPSLRTLYSPIVDERRFSQFHAARDFVMVMSLVVV